MTDNYGVLLTATQAISHHDPKRGSGGNALTFLREKVTLRRETQDDPIFQKNIDAICAANPMPETIEEILSRIDMVEWLSVTFVRVLLDAYNAGDGDGLLSGMERYQMLDKRLEIASVKAQRLHTLLSAITTGLQLPVHAQRHDAQITRFFSLPPSIQGRMLQYYTENHGAVVTLARYWHTENKAQSAEYCERAGRPFVPQKEYTAAFSVQDIEKAPVEVVIEIPSFSGNSIRHQVVREPAMLHLFEALGLNTTHADKMEIATETLFANGGNIKSGAKMPEIPEEALKHVLAMFGNGGLKEKGASESSRAWELARQVRETYPSLDLLGGVCNAFDLGKSALNVAVVFVCKENRWRLPEQIAESDAAQLSGFDYIAPVTRTHQAHEGLGQMINSYETLAPGAQLWARFSLLPFTPQLTRGALMAALDYYSRELSTVGGQAARGHGQVSITMLDEPDLDALHAYNAYLTEHQDDLRTWILDGSLGTGEKWVVK